MKIIKPSVEFFGAVPTDYDGALKFIEMAGRTCYKSEDKITETSAESFVKKLIKAGHLAMVEHSNFVVRADVEDIDIDASTIMAGKYLNTFHDGGFLYVGGSLTAWGNRYDSFPDDEVPIEDELFTPFFDTYGDLFERGNESMFGAWQPCPHDEIPHELHRYSAKFICDRGVSHELVRHRPCSFAQESTRYVNYGGKDMEFIEPAGDFDKWPEEAYEAFLYTLTRSEREYNIMLSAGLKPQQARVVLPNALKTEIVVTADAAEWAHIFKLRRHPSAHPDFVRLAVPLRDAFIAGGII